MSWVNRILEGVESIISLGGSTHAERRRARHLAMLSLGNGVLVLLVSPALIFALLRMSSVRVGLIVTGVLFWVALGSFTAYALARFGKLLWGGLLLCVGSSAGVFASVLMTGGFRIAPSFLCLCVLMGALVLTPRMMFLLTLGNVLTLFLISMALPMDALGQGQVVFFGVLILATGVLSYLGARANAYAFSEVARASEAKGIFLANMSHEMRTPLTSVLGYAELLLEIADERGDEDIEDLKHIHTSATHLRDMINDVLDLSKIEAGHMAANLAPVPMEPLFQELDAIGQQLSGRHTNQWVFERQHAPESLVTDRIRLVQILVNLLSNAAKFTKSGQILLLVSTTQSLVQFEVRDTGIGMTPDQLELVFNVFEQASTTTHVNYGGTGLGLALSRELSQLLDGTLEASSEVGVGSTFVLSLPLVQKLP